jgi:hypothetical protein
MSPAFLFNTDFFLSRTGQTPFQVFTQGTEAGEARFVCSIENGHGLSPYRAPFGSIEFPDTWSQAELAGFVSRIDEQASTLQLSSMRIISYPECYVPTQAALLTPALLAAGYELLFADTTYYIPVSEQPFHERIHRMEQKRLRKFKRAGFKVVQNPSPDMPEHYTLIADTRLRKGYPVSLRKEQFYEMVEHLKAFCKIFSIHDGATLVATAIVIEVSPDILYSFYVADHAAYRSYSPVVALYEAVYTYAQSHQYKILDYGIGTENGIENYTLSAFKRHIGGIPSHKPTFLKKY